MSWTYLRNHDEMDKFLNKFLKLFRSCQQLPVKRNRFLYYSVERRRLGAFLDLVRYAEQEARKMYLRCVGKVLSNHDAARNFFLDCIYSSLVNNERPDSIGYSETVKVAKLLRNGNPVAFVKEVFKKAQKDS